ncbi:MAG: diphthine synthase [Candidatus Aenigmarchaeota archaeon]|nr:diphthine synthase [Candidatus Aenigmarchaeota archaeon]
MLYMIGLGISGIGDITLKGAEMLGKSDAIFMEEYTCPLNIKLKDLEKLTGKKITLLDRKGVEEDNNILKNASKKDIAFLVGGDPLSATTHKELLIEAKQKNIKYTIIHSSSIFSAVAECGLELYNFGKTVSLPFFARNFTPQSPYENIEKNKANNLHTLLLLDIGMDVKTAINQLMKIEKQIKHNLFTSKSMLIACKNIGSDDSGIKYDTIENLLKMPFSNKQNTLYCLVIPAKLNFKEKEYLSVVV